MTIVIILIHVQVGKAADVTTAVEKIDNVTWAHMVSGLYDVIAHAELPSRLDFRRLVESIHEVPGVSRTETCLAL